MDASWPSRDQREWFESYDRNAVIRRAPPPPRRQDAPTLRTLFGIYPIRERIVRCLDTRDALHLCETSWAMRHDIKANEWDINVKLGRFVKDPVGFRSQLGRSDALISGSFALQFFERVVWPEADLDIMVQDGESLDGLAKLLIEKEGYEMVGERNFSEDDDEVLGYRTGDFPDMKKTQTYMYRKKYSIAWKESNDTGRKVQLIATYGPPVQAILRGYYTTALVNFISWNKAYSIFPRSTFLSHETVPLKVMDEYFGTLHSKYSRRGWRMRTESVMVEGLSLPDPLGSLAKKGNRRVGDRDTWIIKLDTSSVAKPPKPDFVLEYSCFQIAGLQTQGVGVRGLHEWSEVRASLNLSIYAGLFQSHSLRYRYTYGYDYEDPDFHTPLHLFWDQLGKRMSRNTLGQLMKLGQAKVDEIVHDQSPQSVILYMLEFEHPEGWDYYDDLVPVLYDQMESNGHI
ncbi:hypothetical protein F4809DRAFT_599895 [Biscogniauxia mediterranea]|nr:hypothetical protein F4809DRAFT_599895 [Biscogniauxia mediterranea]